MDLSVLCLEVGHQGPILDSGLGEGLVGQYMLTGSLPMGLSQAKPKA